MNETQRDTQKITENHLINSYLSFPKKKKKNQLFCVQEHLIKKVLALRFRQSFCYKLML